MSVMDSIRRSLRLEFDFNELWDKLDKNDDVQFDDEYEQIRMFYFTNSGKRGNQVSKLNYLGKCIKEFDVLLEHINLTTNGLGDDKAEWFKIKIEDLQGELVIEQDRIKSADKTARPKITINGDYSTLLVCFEKLIDSKYLYTKPYRIAQLLADNFVQKNGKEIKEESVNSLFTKGLNPDQESKLKKLICP